MGTEAVNLERWPGSVCAPAECVTLREVFEKQKVALDANEREKAGKELHRQTKELKRLRKKAEHEVHQKEVLMA